MFERFTADCRRAVVLAQEEARMLCHPFVGAEHLLLGLLGLPADPSVALVVEAGLDLPAAREAVRRWHAVPGPELDAEALDAIGIDLDAVREKVEAAFGVGALTGSGGRADRRRRGGGKVPGGHLPFTPEAKKTLELSLREALALKSRAILPGHLLLGLLRAEGTPVTRILADRGIDLDALGERIRSTID